MTKAWKCLYTGRPLILLKLQWCKRSWYFCDNRKSPNKPKWGLLRERGGGGQAEDVQCILLVSLFSLRDADAPCGVTYLDSL